ncbi:MAG: hypothetical protein U0271_06725 [Polyangiaceae bacterium]
MSAKIKAWGYGLAASAMLAFVVVGCTSGLSTDDAEARCDQERDARDNGGCFEDTTYDECVAAYEDCGEDVNITESCPVQYVCPAD